MKIAGFIYCIRNLVNGRRYIGLTTKSVKTRWIGHVSSALSRSENSCALLSRAIRKHGADNFEVFELDRAHSVAELRRKECLWIEKEMTAAPHGYNLTDGAEGHVVWLGRSRKKQSEKQKARFSAGPETNPMFGRKHSEESRRLNSEAQRRTKSDPAWRKAKSAAMKMFFADHPEHAEKIRQRAIVRHHERPELAKRHGARIKALYASGHCNYISHEAKQKHRAAVRAALSRPEVKERIAAARTQDWKDRISNTLKGRTATAEQRARRSVFQLGKKRGPYRKREQGVSP